MQKLKGMLLVTSVYTQTEIKEYLLPLLHEIISGHRNGKTTIIGIQGGQGTGKTTLSKFLQEMVQRQGYSVEAFSLDDFYTPYGERKKLAQKYPDNPFYQISRGLPGTHRVRELLQTLRNIKVGKPFTIPLFDKSLHNAQGDIAGEKIITKKLDFVIFEGWCLGLPLISGKELERICRKNKIVPPLARHYQVVLRFLNQYQPIWKYIDYLIMLKPAFSSLHQQWRWQQEQELRQKTGTGMSKVEVEHFVGMYLPFTYIGYEKVKPKVKITLDLHHRIKQMKIKK